MADGDTAEPRGPAFEHSDLTRARFADVDRRGARVEHSGLSGLVMRGVGMVDASIVGEIENLVVNGVDVVPLVEAGFDRRDPDRQRFRPTTAVGFRRAWTATSAVGRHGRPGARGSVHPARAEREWWWFRRYDERDLTVLEERG